MTTATEVMGNDMEVKAATYNILKGECDKMETELKGSGLLIVEPVKPKDGDFVQEKPFDVQPVLQRMSIISSAYDDLKMSINSTDTSRITDEEMNAYNEIARAFENARDVLVGLIR